MYQPPNTPAYYWDIIQNKFEGALNCGIKNVIIGGDLNCNQKIQPSELSACLCTLGCTIMNNEVTRRINESETIFATNNTSALENITTTAPSLSKHGAVVGTLRHMRSSKAKVNRKIFDYDKANWDNLNKEYLNTTGPR